MNLQEELKALKERITELEEQAKEEQEFPKLGDKYHFIVASGGVDWLQWDESGFGLRAQDIGNIFRTKQQAEFAVEKLKVEAELRKLSVSWDLEKAKYTFSFDWECGELKIEYPDYNQYPNSYYFYSADDVQQAIESVGEECIKKYIFGVED